MSLEAQDSPEEKLKRIADALNDVQRSLRYAEPDWETGEWSIRQVVNAIDGLSTALGEIAGLVKETSVGGYGYGVETTFTLPKE